MTKIILQAKPQQEPARLIIETNFPDGRTQPYALTNASITHFTKATKEDGILFLTNSGIENVQIHRDNTDRKSTRLNSSHIQKSRMPSSA